MSLQYSVAVRNDRLDALETTIGTSAVLKFFTGALPASTADPDSGTVLATLNLPSDWLGSASGGTKVKTGTWQDVSADASGTVVHFRVYDSSELTCHIQGTVGLDGSGADMTIDSTSFTAGQTVTVTSFQITAGNA